MEQTAVEWYQKAILEILKQKENLSYEMFLQNMLNAYLQAKEMEKKQKGYSEEEVVQLNLRYLQELGKQQSENGHCINFKEWFEKFNN